MLTFFKDFFGAKQKLKESEARVLELESIVQSLKLDLSEQEKNLAQIKAELSLLSKKQDSTVKGMVSSQTENFLKDMAAPVAQLVTQFHLCRERPVQLKDVLAVSMRLVSGLEALGLKLEGKIGDIVDFDSSRHEGLSLEAEPPAEGSPVTITMPGVSYDKKLLRKTAVVSVERGDTSPRGTIREGDS